jgi:hypothetical protein
MAILEPEELSKGLETTWPDACHIAMQWLIPSLFERLKESAPFFCPGSN